MEFGLESDNDAQNSSKLKLKATVPGNLKPRRVESIEIDEYGKREGEELIINALLYDQEVGERLCDLSVPAQESKATIKSHTLTQ